MFGSSILEVAIGVVFVYLFISLICSAINEWIASALVNKRGKTLFDGVTNLLNDPKFTGLAQQLYTHGLVDGISQDSSHPTKSARLPSYMPSNTFALALMDILGSQGIGKTWGSMIEEKKAALDAAQLQLKSNPADIEVQKRVDDATAEFNKASAAKEQSAKVEVAHAAAATAAEAVDSPRNIALLKAASTKLQEALALGRKLAADYPDPLGNIQRAVEGLPEGHTKVSLLVLIDKTRRETTSASNKEAIPQLQTERLRENIEQWFNNAMDRVGGWYKRWTQKVVLLVAIVVVLGINVDTIMLAKRFARDNALRASIVSAAEKTIQSNAANPTKTADARQAFLKEADQLTLPIGWVAEANDPYVHERVPRDTTGWLMKLLGLVISVFAISLGAPFWFDLLSKFVNVRGAGTPPGETKKSAPQPG